MSSVSYCEATADGIGDVGVAGSPLGILLFSCEGRWGPQQRRGWDSATTEGMGLNNCVIHNGYGYEGDDGEDDE